MIIEAHPKIHDERDMLVMSIVGSSVTASRLATEGSSLARNDGVERRNVRGPLAFGVERA